MVKMVLITFNINRTNKQAYSDDRKIEIDDC